MLYCGWDWGEGTWRGAPVAEGREEERRRRGVERRKGEEGLHLKYMIVRVSKIIRYERKERSRV